MPLMKSAGQCKTFDEVLQTGNLTSIHQADRRCANENKLAE
jgi:hypothetical protein